MAKLDLGRVYGKSAYEIALDNGFKGSEQEWLDSLKATGGHLLNDFLPTPSEQLAFGNNNGQFVIEDEKRRYIFRKQLVYKYIPKVLEIDNSEFKLKKGLYVTDIIQTIKYGDNKFNLLIVDNNYVRSLRLVDLTLKDSKNTLTFSRQIATDSTRVTGVCDDFYVFGSHVFANLKDDNDFENRGKLDPVFYGRRFLTNTALENNGHVKITKLNNKENYVAGFNTPLDVFNDEMADIDILSNQKPLGISSSDTFDFLPTFIKTDTDRFLIMQKWTDDGSSRFLNIVRLYNLTKGGYIELNIPTCNTHSDIISGLLSVNMVDFNQHVGIIRSEFLESSLENEGFTPIIVDTKEFVKKCWEFGRISNDQESNKVIPPKNVFDICKACLIDGLTPDSFANYFEEVLVETCKGNPKIPRPIILGMSRRRSEVSQIYRGHVFTKNVSLVGVQKNVDHLRTCIIFYNSKSKKLLKYYTSNIVTAHQVNNFDFDFDVYCIDYKENNKRVYIRVTDDEIIEILDPYILMGQNIRKEILKPDSIRPVSFLYYSIDKHKYPFTCFNAEVYPRFDFFHDDIGVDEDGFLIKLAHLKVLSDDSPVYITGLGKKWDYVLTDITDKEVF